MSVVFLSHTCVPVPSGNASPVIQVRFVCCRNHAHLCQNCYAHTLRFLGLHAIGKLNCWCVRPLSNGRWLLLSVCPEQQVHVYERELHIFIAPYFLARNSRLGRFVAPIFFHGHSLPLPFLAYLLMFIFHFPTHVYLHGGMKTRQHRRSWRGRFGANGGAVALLTFPDRSETSRPRNTNIVTFSVHFFSYCCPRCELRNNRLAVAAINYTGLSSSYGVWG